MAKPDHASGGGNGSDKGNGGGKGGSGNDGFNVIDGSNTLDTLVGTDLDDLLRGYGGGGVVS